MAVIMTCVLLWLGRLLAARAICLSFQIDRRSRTFTISPTTSTTGPHLGFERDYKYLTAFRACHATMHKVYSFFIFTSHCLSFLPSSFPYPLSLSRATHSRGAGGVAPSKIVFDFAGLFLVAILVQNLYTGDPREGLRSLPPQTKNPRYGPALSFPPSLTPSLLPPLSFSFLLGITQDFSLKIEDTSQNKIASCILLCDSLALARFCCVQKK